MESYQRNMYVSAVLLFASLWTSPAQSQQQVLSVPALSAPAKGSPFHSSPFIEGKFSSKRWMDAFIKGDDACFSREDELRRFLQDYNIIGKSREQITGYLGNEDRLSAYTITKGHEGFWRGFCIQYENGKAEKWRLMQGIGHGAWVSTDAIWPGSNGITGPDGKLWAYVPKKLLETNAETINQP